MVWDSIIVIGLSVYILPYLPLPLIPNRAGARFGGGPEAKYFQNYSFRKNCCKSYLNANIRKIKLQGINERINVTVYRAAQ